METNNIDLVKIVASDGHVLTEVEEVENRTFCSVVYLQLGVVNRRGVEVDRHECGG
jgi:predicted CoA-binding protein